MKAPHELIVDNRHGFRAMWLNSLQGQDAVAVSGEEAIDRILGTQPEVVMIGETSDPMLRELGYLQYKHPEIRFYLLHSRDGVHREAEARRWGITILPREKMFDPPSALAGPDSDEVPGEESPLHGRAGASAGCRRTRWSPGGQGRRRLLGDSTSRWDC